MVIIDYFDFTEGIMDIGAYRPKTSAKCAGQPGESATEQSESSIFGRSRGHPEFIHFIDVMLIVGSANQQTAYNTKMIRGDDALRRAWACDNLLWAHIDISYSTVGRLYGS